MFPPEIGRPEKPRPPAGAYPSQILGIIALGPPVPNFFRESFSPEFWVSWTPAGVERAIIPSMRGEGRGPFFRFFGFPLGTLPIFFGLPRCAPRGKPCLLRRRPQPPICLRTSRGRGVPPIARRGRAHAQAQAVLPVSPSREALFPSRYRPAGLRLRSGRPRATGSPSAATTIGIVSVAFWQQSPILVRLARDR